jgi:hypothetical protein
MSAAKLANLKGKALAKMVKKTNVSPIKLKHPVKPVRVPRAPSVKKTAGAEALARLLAQGTYKSVDKARKVRSNMRGFGSGLSDGFDALGASNRAPGIKGMISRASQRRALAKEVASGLAPVGRKRGIAAATSLNDFLDIAARRRLYDKGGINELLHEGFMTGGRTPMGIALGGIASSAEALQAASVARKAAREAARKKRMMIGGGAGLGGYLLLRDRKPAAAPPPAFISH